MSESKHTPGPLTVGNWYEYGINHHAVLNQRNAEAVALTGIVGDERADEQRSIADAHLFAAAPDMLAALEELRDAPWANLCGRAQEVIEAAIAKAKGGE